MRDRIISLDNLGDIETIYPLLEICVHPSCAEGIFLTIREACSCALPVMATAVGGIPEIALEGRTGNLVPLRDARALAVASFAQREVPDVARVMGQSARRSVVECFSLDRMVQDQVDPYRDIQVGRVSESRRG